jgi:DNA processing protein
LADAVVVVEATVSGGASITANDAARFGRDVYALPGSRRNPAAAGCNALLLDGAKPLLEPSDVLFALGCGGSHEGEWRRESRRADGDQRSVLRALAGDGATIGQLEARAELPAERLGAALRALECSGHVERKRGLWWPR